jgi:PIN domain nuclease of toxin-antitoxin system
MAESAVLLDTHALLWWQAEPETKRLSARARKAISGASVVLVSPISCWETTMLLLKGRIALDRDVYQWVQDLLAQDNVAEAPLSPQTAVAAGLLTQAGFHGDPADRLLYATAHMLRVPFVSKDQLVRDYAREKRDVTVVW